MLTARDRTAPWDGSWRAGLLRAVAKRTGPAAKPVRVRPTSGGFRRRYLEPKMERGRTLRWVAGDEALIESRRTPSVRFAIIESSREANDSEVSAAQCRRSAKHPLGGRSNPVPHYPRQLRSRIATARFLPSDASLRRLLTPQQLSDRNKPEPALRAFGEDVESHRQEIARWSPAPPNRW